MRLPAARIAAFLQRPDPAIRAVLLYGPDTGLVRERADILARTVCPDLRDPFRVTDLGGSALTADPVRIRHALRTLRGSVLRSELYALDDSPNRGRPYTVAESLYDVREIEPDDPLREDVELLAAESDRCRNILARLSVDPAEDVSDAYTLVPLPALIEAAAQHYEREGIAITFESGPVSDGVPTTAPIQVRSPEIIQGIGNIVQNAVSFARHEVRIATRWTTEWSQVEVSDDGPGFSEALLDELGTPFISTRQGEEGHMGLGVFIAKTLLERTGAAVTFGNRSGGGGGAAVSVRWSNPVFKAT